MSEFCLPCLDAEGLPVTVFVGKTSRLPESGRPTAIYKNPAAAVLLLGAEGFAGDEQADRRVHGGPEKAVHLYPAGHYPRLAARFPDLAQALQAGSLGENLSARLDETACHVGDVFALGEAVFQINQPRSPCWKIDERFAAEGLAAHIADQGLCGWYGRVLQGGRVTPGDRLRRLEHRRQAPTLAGALQTLAAHRPPPEALERLAATPDIAAHWQGKILQRLSWLRRHAAAP